MKYVLNLIILLMMLNVTHQGSDSPLKNYRWKNRLILVLSDSFDSDKAFKQIKIFKTNEKGFHDRKLLLIQATPESYKVYKSLKPGKGTKILEDTDRPSVKNPEVYKKYALQQQEITVVLIGLDGGVKLKQTEILQVDELFNTIDTMPMRQAEMRRKN